MACLGIEPRKGAPERVARGAPAWARSGSRVFLSLDLGATLRAPLRLCQQEKDRERKNLSRGAFGALSWAFQGRLWRPFLGFPGAPLAPFPGLSRGAFGALSWAFQGRPFKLTFPANLAQGLLGMES